MSGPNTRFMDEPEPYATAPAPESAQAQLQLTPGVVLELGSIDRLLDDLIVAKRTVHLSENYASFEANAHKFAALAQHFAKQVTASRPRPPHRSLSNEE